MKVPEGTADIDHRCDAATEITREEIVEMGANPFALLFVGTHPLQVEGIGPGEDVAGLEEVNVGVDVTWQDKFARTVDRPAQRPGTSLSRRVPMLAMRFPSSTSTALGMILPSWGLMTVPPTSAIFSATTEEAQSRKAPATRSGSFMVCTLPEMGGNDKTSRCAAEARP